MSYAQSGHMENYTIFVTMFYILDHWCILTMIFYQLQWTLTYPDLMGLLTDVHVTKFHSHVITCVHSIGVRGDRGRGIERKTATSACKCACMYMYVHIEFPSVKFFK